MFRGRFGVAGDSGVVELPASAAAAVSGGAPVPTAGPAPEPVATSSVAGT
jgi:hypothetical protein